MHARSLALASSLLFAGCGGGGGGDGEPSIPGSLAALALEGQSAPGTGGAYGFFDTSVLTAVADAGWTAFVADVVGGGTTQALFAARPDGTVELVYALGDPLPDSVPGTGTISAFNRIFITSGGVVVAHVEGTGPTQGILTALLDDESGVVERSGAVYVGQSLPASDSGANPGTLAEFDVNQLAVDDQGSIFFKATGSGAAPVHGIYAVDRSGNGLTAVVASNDAMPLGGIAGTAFSGFGIDGDGVLVAYAVNVIGGSGAKGLHVTDGSTTGVVALDGYSPPNTGARLFEDVHSGGPILVSYDSGTAAVTWNGRLTGGSPDIGVFSRQVVPTISANLETIIAPGQSAASTAGTGSIFADATLLPCQQDPFRIPIEVLVSGGSTDRIFYSFSLEGTGSLDEIFRQSDPAPDADGLFWSSYPSLDTPFTQAAEAEGSVGFSAILDDGTTGIWWAVVGQGFFSVAQEGNDAPDTGGGTFSPFGAAAVVDTANGVVVFRAALSGGLGVPASGLFRQL